MAPSLDVDALYRDHHRMVLRRIRRFVGPEEAGDLAQKVFEQVVRHADGFEGRSSPVTWLYQVTTRVCLHHLRDSRRRAELMETWGTPAWGRPGMVADTETRAFLAQVWRTLEPELTEIGTYHYIDGLTQQEISELLGCSRRTVGNRLAALRDQVIEAATPSKDTA